MSPSMQAVALSGASEAIAVGRSQYGGLTVVETGAAAASVRVFDNAAGPAGTLIDAVNLAAGESVSRIYDRGTWCQEGIWVELTGAVQGSVRVA